MYTSKFVNIQVTYINTNTFNNIHSENKTKYQTKTYHLLKRKTLIIIGQMSQTAQSQNFKKANKLRRHTIE